MTETAPLHITHQHGITTLEFHRPHAMNALDVPMAQAFLAAMQDIAADERVRAVVLRGAGRAFVAGGDLKTLQANPVQAAHDLIAPMAEAVQLMEQLNAPVIAQVHGAVAGAGMSLMMLCDFVWAAEGTKFNLAYINLGACCDVGASWALPRLVGQRHALEIAMLGEAFGTDDALRWGLVNRVVPQDGLTSSVHAFAERLANGPTRAYGHMRRLMRSSWNRDLGAQLHAEARAFEDCARTADFQTGVDAFFAQQKPMFAGR